MSRSTRYSPELRERAVRMVITGSMRGFGNFASHRKCVKAM